MFARLFAVHASPDLVPTRIGGAGRPLVGAVTALFVAATLLSSMPEPTHAADPADSSQSDLRIGVLAVADTIAAIGQLPELSQPLPFTQTSLASVLQLDGVVTGQLIDLLGNPETGTDLVDALALMPGFTGVEETEDGLSFGYQQSTTVPLPLAFDDGSLRIGRAGEAGDLAVTLSTSTPFVMSLDAGQPDPLLRFSLTGGTKLCLSTTADIDLAAGAPVFAREGFTELAVSDGHYRIDQTREITLRDPDGRAQLSLEDLRYSTLVDLFRIQAPVEGDDDGTVCGEPRTSGTDLDVRLDVALPEVTVNGGAAGSGAGTILLAGNTQPNLGWPDPSGQRTETYGTALKRLAGQTEWTDPQNGIAGITAADGLTGFAEYTGAALAIQNAADIDFRNVDASLADVFAPADALMDVLATAGVATVRCGLTPTNPPEGIVAPGDTAYCDAVTAEGIGDGAAIEDVTWFVPGRIVAPDTVGSSPGNTVSFQDPDGRLDVHVEFTVDKGTADERTYTARTIPRTVQDILRRLRGLAADSPERGLAGAATAVVDLASERLEVGVAITTDDAHASVPVGDPSTLGALVGLTGLSSGGTSGDVTVSAEGGAFRTGFSVPFHHVQLDADGEITAADKETVELVPAGGNLLEVEQLAVDDPDLSGLSAQIGFLGVTADVTGLALDRTPGAGQTVAIERAAGSTGSIPVDALTVDGGLSPQVATLVSNLQARIRITATEAPVQGVYLVGDSPDTPESGWVRVTWSPDSSLPAVDYDPAGGYASLRVLDPVPAVLVHGVASVDESADADVVNVDVDTSMDLLATFHVGAGTEIAREALGDHVACQTITIRDAATFTCTGLAPDGVAAFASGDPVDLIVLGEPGFLRDGLFEGFARSLKELEWLDGDNNGDEDTPDQLLSALPMVDLLPRQMAPERARLARGVARLVGAATADDAGTPAGVDEELPRVSSAQSLAAHLGDLVAPDATITYAPSGSTTLAVKLALAADDTVPANLQFMAPGPEGDPPVDPSPLNGQVRAEEPLDIAIHSRTVLAVEVGLGDATVGNGAGTKTISSASLDPATGVIDETIDAGSTTVHVTGDAGLGVTVETKREGGTLVTRRSGDGATVHLSVPQPADEDPETADVVEVTYAWPPEASSGAGGEAPSVSTEPMDLSLLAGGLSALADRLDVALDGTSSANTSETGPMSAPLIGTDLDAGAGIPGKVRDTAKALGDALGTRDLLVPETGPNATVEDIVAELDLVDDAADVDATCETVDGGDCGSDPTAWDTVTVSFTLTEVGLRLAGDDRLPFSTGLADLAVRSNEKIETAVTWSLPVTLELVRGVGPKVCIGTGGCSEGELAVDIHAWIPDAGGLVKDRFDLTTAERDEICPADVDFCLPAIIGYLPGVLTGKSDLLSPDDSADGDLETRVTVGSDGSAHSVFEVKAGRLPLTAAFPGDGDEGGLTLGFETVASKYKSFDLVGEIRIPWQAPDGFTASDPVAYENVKLDVGEVIGTLAKPFAVADPYLGPARDVIDVLRQPVPVVSDLSRLAGLGDVTLLRLLEKLSAPGGDDAAKEEAAKKKLQLAYRIITFVEKAIELNSAVAGVASDKVSLDDLKALGPLLSIDPTQVSRTSCKQAVVSFTATFDDEENTAKAKLNEPSIGKCDDETSTGWQQLEVDKVDRKGQVRKVSKKYNAAVASETRSFTASMPGFSLPFIDDPDQLLDLLAGTGEATYFRIDLGTLEAKVGYSVKLPPIPVGPVPVRPYIGGSIAIQGRLAFGFDSMPQTLAVRSLADPGDVTGLVRELKAFSSGDILREAFYIDDLDESGVDVPEVKLITTIEAGAGVSIAIATAGIKGALTITIDLNLNDPNRDGRIRATELKQWAKTPACVFDASGLLQFAIKFFWEIDLLFTTKGDSYNLIPPVTVHLFDYACVAEGLPELVKISTAAGERGRLLLETAAADRFEIRQFDTDGGVIHLDTDGSVIEPPDGISKTAVTLFEVAARGLVQRVEVRPDDEGTFTVVSYKPAEAISGDPNETVTEVPLANLVFVANGNGQKNDWSFLAGDTYDDTGALVTTRFQAPVIAKGKAGNDSIVTGDAVDRVEGGQGDDRIDTGSGDDQAWGEKDVPTTCDKTCDDSIQGGPGFDRLDGGPGNDALQGGPGPDLLVGGSENDTLIGGPGRDVTDVIESASAETTPQEYPESPPLDVWTDVIRQAVDGFDTGDVLVGGDGGDTLDGGDGSDIVIGGTGDRTLVPEETGRSVKIKFTYAEGSASYKTSVSVEGLRTAPLPTADELDALCESGDETSGAASDADTVTGGTERDILVGGNGPDTLTGGPGPDEICGLAGDDLLVGEDVLTEGAEANGEESAQDVDDGDIIRGGHGNDRVYAGPGDDVVFGDDVTLVRDSVRVLDGTLGDDASGHGNDYLDGGDGNDILAGGDGADLLVGGAGNDIAAGEGRDTEASGGGVPPAGERLVDCRAMTRIVAGHVDLNGDLLASGLVSGDLADQVDRDDGQLAGLVVSDGLVLGPDGSPYYGLVGDETVVIGGLVDLDRDGEVYDPKDGTTGDLAEDTGLVRLASMRIKPDGSSFENPDGDCILGGNGEDALLGGTGSDHAIGGNGKDFLDGGAGNDLLVGEGGTDPLVPKDDSDLGSYQGGTDVILGGPDDDVLVGGEGFDYLEGGPGDDRLRGNEGFDDLIGGSREPGAEDGQDVLLGGRGDDVLAGENARISSQWIIDEVEPAWWHGGGFDLPAEVETFPGDPATSSVGCRPEWPRWLTLLPGGGEDRVASTRSDPDHDWYDELYGGFDCDWVFGQEGDDLVRGGQDTDMLEGGPGSDTVMGDDGSDVLVGGSSVRMDPANLHSGDIVKVDLNDPASSGRSGEGVPDGDDILIGDGGADHMPGADVLVGDNAIALPADGMSSNRLLLTDLLAPAGSDVAGDDVLIGDDPAGGIPVAGSIDTSDPLACEGAASNQGYPPGPVEPPGGGGYPPGVDPSLDPRLPDWLFGQGGDDCLAGGPDPDYLEGNAGDDVLAGGPGNDDLLGGSSATDGKPFGTGGMRMQLPFASIEAQLADTSAAGLPDGSDTAWGGDGDDIILGDNGRILRPWDESARQVVMADTTPGLTSGSDLLAGGDGNDILYGQLDDTTAYPVPVGDRANPLGRTQALGSGDRLLGEAGDDVIVGDLGIVVMTEPASLGADQTLTVSGTAISERVYASGRMIPVTFTSEAMVTEGGADVALGGDGDDVIRLGAGDDLANGDDWWPNADGSASLHTGDDVLFGSLGVDALWGGTGHDRLFGGYGSDLLDVKPRPDDPGLFREVAPLEDSDGDPGTVNGPDLAYGGWGSDELQADVTAPVGETPPDVLVDWIAKHDLFYLCDKGQESLARSPSTAMLAFLGELARASGATDVDVNGSAGWYELGLVRLTDLKDNTAKHPLTPGSYTCSQ